MNYLNENSESDLKTPLTVTALSMALKNHVETRFSHISIRGEVINAKQHSSGHLYFTLKDDQSTLAAVSWRGMVARFPLRVQDGMDIICQGRLTTYPLQSKYQLVVDSVALAGQGSLLKKLEDLRRQLEAEGLFHVDRKKPLPFLPKIIGMITSPTGAVIQDMLHRLRDRCPTQVLLWPVLVQGTEASRQIVEAIEGFNALDPQGSIPRPDLLIVARGGGSLEDLWPFNEECVVRAVAASSIPLISGVGHEPDVTLIDYVSDHRAPTPTAAIERAVPVRLDVFDSLKGLHKRMDLYSLRQWEDLTQRLDHMTRNLIKSMASLLMTYDNRCAVLKGLLRHPKETLNLIDVSMGHLFMAMNKSLTRYMERQHMALSQVKGLLESYSIDKTLKRGFIIAFDKKNVVLSSKNLQKNQRLSLKWHDGTKEVIVDTDS